MPLNSYMFPYPIYLNNENYIYDPLKAGVYFGLLGAGMGLSYAVTKKTILSSKNYVEDSRVIKPMLIGALIGSVFGATASHFARNNLSKSDPLYSWEDVYNYINTTANFFPKTSSLKKHASLNKSANVWDTAKTIGYFIPGVASALSVGDAVGAGADAFRHLSRGNYAQAAGRALSMFGNLGLAALGLVPFGGALVRGGIRLAGKALPAALNAAKLSRASSILANYGAAYRNTLNSLHQAKKTLDKALTAYQKAVQSGVGVDDAQKALAAASAAISPLTQKANLYSRLYARMQNVVNQRQLKAPNNASFGGEINRFLTNVWNSAGKRIANWRGTPHVPHTGYESFSRYMPKTVERIGDFTGRVLNPVVSRLSPTMQQRLGLAMQNVGSKLVYIPGKGYTLGFGALLAQTPQMAGDHLVAYGQGRAINRMNRPSPSLYSTLRSYNSLNASSPMLSSNFSNMGDFQYSPISSNSFSFYNPKYYGFTPEYSL